MQKLRAYLEIQVNIWETVINLTKRLTFILVVLGVPTQDKAFKTVWSETHFYELAMKIPDKVTTPT